MMKRIILATAAIAFATAVFAAPATTSATMGTSKILADAKGMVLYTYDKDTKGAAAAACTAACPASWPAFVPAPTDKADADWTIINGLDKDGKAVKQWAYKGLPLYYYAKDVKAGDTTGDNVANVWHVVKM